MPPIAEICGIAEDQMKTLDVQARLEYARAGVAVLRALGITDTSMRYHGFATAIGLIPDGGKWEPWHRQQVAEILQVMAATEKTAGKKTGTVPLEFARIVTAKGEPGAGVRKTSKIVRD
jgi:hypothetical protein